MLSELKILCKLNGASGNEDIVRDYIVKEAKKYGETTVDNAGNVIVFKKGTDKTDKKVMVCAHMDEVALIVTYIDGNGFLKFDTVGGIDTAVLAGKKVTVNGIDGVIGVKPVHFYKEKELPYPETKDLYIDIGAKDKNDAQKYVTEGDIAYFNSDNIEFGGHFFKAKAIDDRLGCAIMLKMLKSELKYDTYFAFVVQEEVSGKGASAAAFTIEPDYAIVIESTTASDIPGVTEENRVCTLGGGAVISFMDRATLYDKDLYKTAFKVAKEKNIKIQPKTKVAGGNDSRVIHKSKGGVKTIAVSCPTRYLHSPACVIDINDIEPMYNIVKALSEVMAVDKIN